MDSRGEASVGQLNNHPPFVNPPSIPLLYCSSAGWYTAETPRGFFFFSFFFLYFSLYRQIRATVRIYYPRNERYAHDAIRQAGNCIVLSAITNFPIPIEIFTPISWRTLRSDGFREHDRHFRILDQILRSISCHVRSNWSNADLLLLWDCLK